MNIRDNKIWCHECKKEIDLYTETLVLEDINVICNNCYPTHYTHLGYIWDVPQWRDDKEIKNAENE